MEKRLAHLQPNRNPMVNAFFRQHVEAGKRRVRTPCRKKQKTMTCGSGTMSESLIVEAWGETHRIFSYLNTVIPLIIFDTRSKNKGRVDRGRAGNCAALCSCYKQACRPPPCLLHHPSELSSKVGLTSIDVESLCQRKKLSNNPTAIGQKYATCNKHAAQHVRFFVCRK
jgi:hypothetical protein